MKTLRALVLLVVLGFNAALARNESHNASFDGANGNATSKSCFPLSWNELMEVNIVVVESQVNCSLIMLRVLRCYCLTESHISTEPPLSVGCCLYGCFNTERTTEYHRITVSKNTILKGEVCSLFNRKGTLCGQCMDGYGAPVYSFSLKCVKCGDQSLWKTVSLYILIAYGPLTVFLGVIVVFTISVNSAPLRGWILVCQLLSYSFLMRIVVSREEAHSDHFLYPYIPILGSIYGVWNLDFFRLVYKPFCLHPSLTTLHVISLDYIVAAYPLVLITVMYKLVDLYSRNFQPIVFMGRLFHHCCIRFRHRLNIRTSLIDAFGTFFSLSYVKFLSTTVDLLIYTEVRNNENNAIQSRSYFDGTMELFRGKHIPYAVVGIFIFIVCNVVPLILMLLYTFPRAHMILNRLPTSVQVTLYPFMDNILSCYKDGTNGTKNCRYFGVVYHVALLAYIGCMTWAESTFFFGVNTSVCIITGMLVAVIQPYKSKVYNTVDIILILSIGLCFAGLMAAFIAYIDAPTVKTEGAVMTVLPFTIPSFYMVGYLGYKCFCKIRHRQFFCYSTIVPWMRFQRRNGFELIMENHI